LVKNREIIEKLKQLWQFIILKNNFKICFNYFIENLKKQAINIKFFFY